MECCFSLLVLCFVMWVMSSHEWSSNFSIFPFVKWLIICKLSLAFPLCSALCLPSIFLPLPLWPHSQAGDQHPSRRHADRQHKLRREHQIGAHLARPGSQHPLPSSVYHAILDLGRYHPDCSASIPRLPAMPGAPDRPLARRQRKQQRQLLRRQRPRRRWSSRRWHCRCGRRRRWDRRWRWQLGRSHQPVRAARLQPVGRAPQGVERTRPGGRKHQAHEIGCLGHIKAPTPSLCTHSEVLVTPTTRTHTHS